MVQRLFEAKVFIYVMMGMCVIGIGIKFLIYFTYKKLITASNDMGNSQNKLMKILRLKFETYYKLKIGVNNVDAFVDKYVYKYRIGKVLLSTWENISGQALVFCLLIGTIGAVSGIVMDCRRVDVLTTVFFGVFTSGLLIAIENIMNLPTKRSVLRISIKDYLENYLKARLENEHLHPEIIEQYRNEYFETKPKATTHKTANKAEEEEEDVKELLESIEAMAAEHVKDELRKKAKKSKTFELSKSDEKIIEEILKEYLI